MATYDIAAIRAALKALMITATEIQNVYDYMNPVIAGYPAIIFDIDNEEGSMLDDANNVRVLTFKVWITVEVNVATQTTAKDNLDSAVKSIINILEKKSNDTLSGTVDWVMPVIGARSQSVSPEGNFMYQELLVKCNIASSIL